jgi:hypothetical protein
VIHPERIFKLACEAAEAGAQHIHDVIEFDPREEPIDPEKADAVVATITYMAAVVIGRLITNFPPEEVPAMCNHIVSQAMGLAQASANARKAQEEAQARPDSPIILPGDTNA